MKTKKTLDSFNTYDAINLVKSITNDYDQAHRIIHKLYSEMQKTIINDGSVTILNFLNIKNYGHKIIRNKNGHRKHMNDIRVRLSKRLKNIKTYQQKRTVLV